MKKILFILAVIFCAVSCTNKEYCKSCESEIRTLNGQLDTEYFIKQFIYSKLTSDEIDYYTHLSYQYEYEKVKNKIEELEEKRKYYELEIKKESREWEFSEITKQTYDKLKNYE
jgi:hypothetical protein